MVAARAAANAGQQPGSACAHCVCDAGLHPFLRHGDTMRDIRTAKTEMARGEGVPMPKSSLNSGRQAVLRSSEAISFAVILAGIAGCQSEAPPRESGTQFCSDCVDFRAVGLVDFASAPTLPSGGGLLLATPDSAHLFVDPAVRHEVLVFDGEGHYRTRFGALGDGPGEFDRIGALAFDSADTLWVASRGGHRLDLFGPDFRFARSLRPEVSIQTIVPMPQGMAVAAADGLEGQIGIMGQNGRVDVLWRDSVPRGSGFPAGVTALASSDDGTIWFAEDYAYRVWRIRPGEGPVQVLGEAPAWFEAKYPDDVMERFRINDQGGMITDLRVDDIAGVLWMTSAIPAEGVTVGELEPLFEDPESFREEIMVALLDHVVEAYDLTSERRIGVGPGESNVSYRSPLLYRIGGPETMEVVAPILLRR